MGIFKDKDSLKFAVIGAGHGWTEMAGNLSLLGFDVSLYNRSPEKIKIIQLSGGVDILSDQINIPKGFAKLTLITSDIE